MHLYTPKHILPFITDTITFQIVTHNCSFLSGVLLYTGFVCLTGFQVYIYTLVQVYNYTPMIALKRTGSVCYQPGTPGLAWHLLPLDSLQV